MTVRFAIALVAVAALGGSARAGAQEGRKTFDVASIKRNVDSGAKTNAQVLPNGFNLTNLDLGSILGMAYGIQRHRLIGAPEWIETRYDLSARSETPVTLAEMRPMLQALLEDRFKLKLHTESRAMPGYALVLARSDGRLGERLRPSTVECARPAQAAIGNAGGPNAVLCGPRPGGPGKLILVGSPIGQLVSLLALTTGRPVVDKTGLTGRYDLELTHAAEPAPGVTAPPPDPLAPSLFTALEEQLGLKLDATKEQVDVWVIDRIEPLTEN